MPIGIMGFRPAFYPHLFFSVWLRAWLHEPGWFEFAGVVSMFVKRNKNQLRDYMTTGPAHTEAARLTRPARLM